MGDVLQTLGVSLGLQSESYLRVNVAAASAANKYSWGKYEMS